MRFLLQNSIMTARSPPCLLNAATVIALHIQNVTSETTQQPDVIHMFTLNLSLLRKVKVVPHSIQALKQKPIQVSRQLAR